MKKRLIALIAVLAVLLGAAGCAANKQEQARVPITMYLWALKI